MRQDVKDKIAKEAKALLDGKYPLEKFQQGRCLYATAAAVCVLSDYGVISEVHAGDCFWPRLAPQHETPEDMMTHFGFQWENSPAKIKQALARGSLPEIHIWAYLPFQEEILDLTTGDFPRMCRSMLLRDWKGERPPDHLWCKANSLPKGVCYKMRVEATLFTMSVMNTIAGD